MYLSIYVCMYVSIYLRSTNISGTPSTPRCRANMAHVRQSRPESGRAFQVEVLNMFDFQVKFLNKLLNPKPQQPQQAARARHGVSTLHSQIPQP